MTGFFGVIICRYEHCQAPMQKLNWSQPGSSQELRGKRFPGASAEVATSVPLPGREVKPATNSLVAGFLSFHWISLSLRVNGILYLPPPLLLDT